MEGYPDAPDNGEDRNGSMLDDVSNTEPDAPLPKRRSGSTEDTTTGTENTVA